MKTIAVYNNKGGIGKTTFAVHVALYAAKHRIRTMVVGLDRQGDVCRWLAGGDCELQDGLHFRKGDYLQVIYSPMALPDRIKNCELVIVDCPPTVEVVDKLSADLWLVPLDGRLAMENLGNIYPSLKQTKGLITLVLNRCDFAGKPVVDALREAAELVPNAVVRGEPIPASAAIAKAAENFRPVWEDGRGTLGDRAIQKLCADVLADCGFEMRKPKSDARQNPVDATEAEPVVVMASTPTPPEAGPRTATKRRSRSQTNAYELPPTRKRQPSRSNHFRLPADVEAHLKELARTYECTCTHVVCSLISSEWQRLKRRESRPAKPPTATP